MVLVGHTTYSQSHTQTWDRYAATHRTALHCTATHHKHSATHCNTLQHTATHCNTRHHHTAKRYTTVDTRTQEPLPLNTPTQTHFFLVRLCCCPPNLTHPHTNTHHRTNTHTHTQIHTPAGDFFIVRLCCQPLEKNINPPREKFRFENFGELWMWICEYTYIDIHEYTNVNTYVYWSIYIYIYI